MSEKLIEFIETRRSIRKFKNSDISNDEIKKILKTAMYAPSAGNYQSWEFVIFTDSEKKRKFSNISPYAYMIKDAPVVILVCGDTLKSKFQEFWVQDCSSIVQTLLLTIHAYGYGAVWTGIYPRWERINAIRQEIDLPTNIVPFALIPLGLSDEKKKKPERFHPEYIHFNAW